MIGRNKLMGDSVSFFLSGSRFERVSSEGSDFGPVGEGSIGLGSGMYL